ncbi:ABC transporter substrate-binding protein [Fidelibacter multiformis]|jgi:NitT/TauT family transport system substrate-binding protein|uniref:ABC transporter substrate-binding protein n=1 Tax=Fidelibacter multiformis TaxID=3377529 RepID=UPI0037DD1665
MKKTALLLLMLLLGLSLLSCGRNVDKNRVVVAQQFGLGYAPIILMQELNLIEKYYPDAQVEWVRLGSGGAIREGMAGGNIDVGSMGVPPYLIAWAKGYDYKIISALCEMPLGLQTYHENVKTLKDIKPGMKIALPSPGSIQHILLSMAAAKELGNPKALDQNIIAMAHPDGVNALINQVEIDGHFTSPPYIFKELEQENIHQVVDARDAFGSDFTFLVTAATGQLKKRNPELFNAVYKALEEAINMLNENPEKTAEYVAPVLNLDRETYMKYTTWEGVRFSTNPHGLLTFLDFMNEAGYVDRNTENVKDLLWETLDPARAD